MKKNVKTSEILSVYQIIGNAKYGKMSNEDKTKAWKIARKLNPSPPSSTRTPRTQQRR